MTDAILDRESLAATVDAVNEALFCERALSKSQRTSTAKWIAGRQGLPGSYAGMFAPTETDRKKGFRLFTGERVTQGPGAAHILGEEACRALFLLDVPLAGVNRALDRSRREMARRLEADSKRGASSRSIWRLPGIYCCPKCSLSLWRRLTAEMTTGSQDFLASAAASLKMHRDGLGGWRLWPFHYALLTLNEIDVPSAVAEMRYAAKKCELYLSKRISQNNKYSQRRRAVAERVLEKCCA